MYLIRSARGGKSEELGMALERYEHTLRWSLNHGWSVILISFVVLISSFMIFGMFNSGVEYFPEDIPPQRAYVQVETPVGTNVEFTKSIVDELERKVPNIPNNQDIETVLSTSGSAITSGPISTGGNSSHRGTIVLNFTDYQRQEGNAFNAIEYARSNFSGRCGGCKCYSRRRAAGSAVWTADQPGNIREGYGYT
ncbi:MAG: hypothetical protein U5K69_27595 [Balneolaceae bacterium]|nr:hypothetical protein [Balneolaceae bacterium]